MFFIFFLKTQILKQTKQNKTKKITKPLRVFEREYARGRTDQVSAEV